MDLGYESFLELENIKLYKCSIIVPLGMKIDNNGTININITNGGHNKFKNLESSFIPKFIDKNNKKNRYTYCINTVEVVDFEDKKTTVYSILNYNVVNERIYYLISIVGFALLTISIIRLYILLTSSGNLNFDIRLLAASVGFLGLFMGLIREGYEIPFRKFVYISILFLLIELALEMAFLK